MYSKHDHYHDMQNIVDDIATTMNAQRDRGTVATYIPELAKINPNQFGIAVVMEDGRVFRAGDANTRFSIQSISKVFTLTLALSKAGNYVWQRVGKEPSGDPFNSIVQLEADRGKPRNPFINAGAIAIADTLMQAEQTPKQAMHEVLTFMRHLANDESIQMDLKVAQSEQRTGDRNAALAHFMASCGLFDNPVDEVLDVYFHHCSIAMDCEQLATAGLFLVSDGIIKHRQESIVSSLRSRRINSLMMLCGHYDGSGNFAYRVGLPGKSGVGGGILTIAPGRAAICVWSPGLNKQGNSHLGSLALEMFAQRTGWSVFAT